jgi:hypothetical protein
MMGLSVALGALGITLPFLLILLLLLVLLVVGLGVVVGARMLSLVTGVSGMALVVFWLFLAGVLGVGVSVVMVGSSRALGVRVCKSAADLRKVWMRRRVPKTVYN